MKTGKTISELAAEIERQHQSKRDFVAPTGSKLRMELDEAVPVLALEGIGGFGPNDLAHGQIAAHAEIPAKYYDRMRREAPGLLVNNVQTWFEKYPAPRMVRTIDGKARAFLSDKYQPLDNLQLAEAVLPALMEVGVEIMSCELTERRLYIKAVDERIKRDVPTGRKIGDGSHCFFDTVSPAVIISNSEVGYGRLSIDYGVYTKVCTNLATIAKEGMKRTHVGGRHEVAENFEMLLSDGTRRATDRAIFMQARDVVRGIFDQLRFAAVTDRLAGMAQDRITRDVDKVVEVTTRKLGATEGEGKSILRHLIEGGDLTRYGLFNAITRTAQDLDDYDRASEFEVMGGKVVEIGQGEWKELALAA